MTTNNNIFNAIQESINLAKEVLYKRDTEFNNNKKQEMDEYLNQFEDSRDTRFDALNSSYRVCEEFREDFTYSIDSIWEEGDCQYCNEKVCAFRTEDPADDVYFYDRGHGYK